MNHHLCTETQQSDSLACYERMSAWTLSQSQYLISCIYTDKFDFAARVIILLTTIGALLQTWIHLPRVLKKATLKTTIHSEYHPVGWAESWLTKSKYLYCTCTKITLNWFCENHSARQSHSCGTPIYIRIQAFHRSNTENERRSIISRYDIYSI